MIPQQVADCSICAALADDWWRCMAQTTDTSKDTFATVVAMGVHLQDDHGDTAALRPRPGCDTCRTVLAVLSAEYSAPGEMIVMANGTELHPSQFHFAGHLIWDMFDLP